MVYTKRKPAYAKIWRNVTSFSQRNKVTNSIQVYQGVFDSDQVLSWSSKLNVRDSYGKGSVFNDITHTLNEVPDKFRYLNGGITLVAKSIITKEMSGGQEISFPLDASIINGTQTQGALKKYHEYDEATGESNPDIPSVEVEVSVIVTTDEDLMTDITVARNVQNKVKSISVYGRKGAFDSLNESLENAKSPYVLNISETDDGYATEKALQVVFALMPDEFWDSNMKNIKRSRPSIYSSKQKWLREYGEKIISGTNIESENIREFISNMIPSAIAFYEESKTNDCWKLRYWQTDGVVKKDGKVVSVKDGYMFPFLVAHSVFVEKNSEGVWELNLPSGYSAQDLVKEIKSIYDDGEELKNVQLFGKSAMTYRSLVKEARIMLS